MKTPIKTLICFLAILVMTGCDLDRFPYDEITSDNMDPNSVETITLGTYAKLKEEYYYKSLHFVNEFGGDNISLSGSTSDLLYNLLTFRRTRDNYYPGRVWKFTYQMIVSVNTIIQQMEEGESSEKDQLLGENYFLRGFLYFQLNNIFGRPYVQSPETNLGIPLKLTADLSDFPPRSTVKEVYEQIIKDLTKAADLMTVDKVNFYASKEVAYAFLSRVYLYMQNWEKAKEYADLVINSGRYSLLTGSDYQKYPRFVPEENKETIFAIRMVKDKDFEDYHMGYYSVGSMYAEIEEQGWGEMYPSSTIMDLYDENESDLRHAFIVNQIKDPAESWMLYVHDVNDVTYNYVYAKVELENGEYVIKEKADDYTDNKVQTETVNGKLRYFVTRKDNGKKYYVKVEPALENRNGYPKRFIYKCSLQEDQSQLYSPVLIRLAELYLNRSEANYHLGNEQAALDDLNVIRERAQIPERVIKDMPTDKTLLDWILQERRLELAWEGHRKLDIFRNGQTLDRRYPGGHLSGAPVYTTVKPDADYILEFIPQTEMDAYPIELVQNP
ncbi:RagB/SusD family nutrient uptake outer membrane protein [Bacteroides sp. 519]|uniref:RagB/SusD family nutrient uptake outer membrane protein n=1 Tax=Bacteroides sp. 519 TaxID=2302937 RepID=UPI0013D306BE|nr:RagB/SusD family nutrient uptake outer membrane protein [Bacteroides sp. 519]NDV57598.1 RagB/SusD family nutrient uptake outer membrane protein [Bacteroides sp. 519]